MTAPTGAPAIDPIAPPALCWRPPPAMPWGQAMSSATRRRPTRSKWAAVARSASSRASGPTTRDGDRRRTGHRHRDRPPHRRRLDAVAAGFVEWYASRPKDIGNQTRAVLSRRDKTGAGDAGHRAAAHRPQGRQRLADADRRDRHRVPGRRRRPAAKAALQVSALTHDDERATRPASCGRQRSGTRCCTAPSTASAATWTRRPATPPRSGARCWTRRKPARREDFPNNGWVVHALQTAWWAITHADQDDAAAPASALEQAVRAGHDTDTTAAIAGALLGARWGASAVPATGGGSCTAGRGPRGGPDQARPADGKAGSGRRGLSAHAELRFDGSRSDRAGARRSSRSRSS